MGKKAKPDVHQQLADEVRELKDAVASLRSEMNETAKRGKSLVAKIGAAAMVTVVAKKLLKLKRRG
jgi:chaperonin cofactor prefoldin